MTLRGPTAVLLAATAAMLACGGTERGVPGSAARMDGAASASGPAGESRTAGEGTEERGGEAVFRRENCGRCHTLFATPPQTGPVSLPRPPGDDAALLTSRVGPDLGLEGHRRSDDWQYAHLYAPDVVSPGSPMPASRQLFVAAGAGRPEPTPDARHLVRWLQSLGRDRRDVWAEFRSVEPEVPIPAPVPDAQRLAAGKRLYARHCVPCHGEAGDGRGPAAALLSRPPRNFITASYRFRSNGPWDPPLDRDLFRSITIGTGIGAAMPAFYFLSAEERWSLVRCLKEFAAGVAATPSGAGEEATGAGPRWAAAPIAGSLAARSGGSGDKATGAVGTAPPPDAETIRQGRTLWMSLGCGRCHGGDAAGRSAAEAGAEWRDVDGVPIERSGDLRHACSRRAGGSDTAFERSLAFGVGAAMPSFGDAIGDGLPAAARALRAYAESLGGPESAADRTAH